MDEHYREYKIQIERVGNTLYGFVWRPESSIEWGSPTVTATTIEGKAVLLKHLRQRIDDDIADRGARAKGAKATRL
jgi:hypothetical protein